MKPCINAREFDCEGMVGDNAEDERCRNCKGFPKRWKGKPVHKIVKRFNNLRRWEHNMEPFVPSKEKQGHSGKVTPLHRVTATRVAASPARQRA